MASILRVVPNELYDSLVKNGILEKQLSISDQEYPATTALEATEATEQTDENLEPTESFKELLQKEGIVESKLVTKKVQKGGSTSRSNWTFFDSRFSWVK